MAKFTGPDLCGLSACDAVDLLRQRKVSPGEMLDAAFARIEAVEPAVNAVPTLCRDRAVAAAGRVTGDADHPGWLGGLPIGIKDLTPVAGVRTTFGTKGLADFVPKASDPLVERLEARGGIVAGKTNTPEFGAGANTFNAVFGATRNAWDTRLNAGGSSGGAAVSLATGELWLSHGSDHGGSLRTPAAFNGIVGLRPTPGRAGGASADNAFNIEGAQGPMARSVEDCALFLDAMAGFEPRFPTSFPAPGTPFREAVRRAGPKVRIAFTPDLNGWSPVDAEVEEHLRAALTMVEREGAVVDEACPELPELERTYHVLRGVMWATLARTLPETVTRHFKETLAENTRFGQALTIDDVTKSNVDRSKLAANMRVFLQDFDVLAMPTVGCMPHPVEEEWVRNVGGQDLAGYMDWLRFAFLATTTGLPAISVPVGIGPRGLPVGLQLVGPPRGEAVVLAVARAVEMAVGGPLGPIDPNVTHRGG